MDTLADLINFDLRDSALIARCKEQLDREGALTLPNFLSATTLESLVTEALRAEPRAYFTDATHNVYLTPNDENLADDHVFNRQVTSTKGCVCDDVIAQSSPLRALYNSELFKTFICAILGEDQLHPYADPLSSINIHYAPEGKELGWHFDNSEFAITLLLQAPDAGGAFEYVKDLRDADQGDMNFEGVDAVLNGDAPVDTLPFEPGTLVLFRGRNSIHRVTPTIGNTTRYLVVLAYNSQPGISLSENARQTFYGRVA